MAEHGGWARVSVTRARAAVLIASLMALIPKLALAASTGGTQDVPTWQQFAAGVAERGPVGIYGIDFLSRGIVYNHPPLVGYLLQLLNVLAHWGIPLALSLRAASSLADVVCALVVFEILRRRRPVPVALAGGLVVATSPILVLVSGYHGNTDSIMMMLLWLACLLLVDLRRGALAGAAVALALSVKLVPVVALPILAVWLVRRGDRRLLARSTAGFLLTTAAVWGPAIVLQGRGLVTNVLGYAGIGDRPWGLVKIADLTGVPDVSGWLTGPGRFVVLLACALVPAVLAWRSPTQTVEAVAVSMAAFLALSPAFGVQYLVWAAVACVVIDPGAGARYNIFGGLFAAEIYAGWNQGLDWTRVALGRTLPPVEVAMGLGVWALLGLTLYRGWVRLLAPEGRPVGSRVTTATRPGPLLETKDTDSPARHHNASQRPRRDTAPSGPHASSAPASETTTRSPSVGAAS